MGLGGDSVSAGELEVVGGNEVVGDEDDDEDEDNEGREPCNTNECRNASSCSYCIADVAGVAWPCSSRLRSFPPSAALSSPSDSSASVAEGLALALALRMSSSVGEALLLFRTVTALD